jgi:IS5 family transposase
MIRNHSQKQMTLEGFETSFEREMDKNNRWVKLGECIPWDALAEACYQSFTMKMGRSGQRRALSHRRAP